MVHWRNRKPFSMLPGSLRWVVTNNEVGDTKMWHYTKLVYIYKGFVHVCLFSGFFVCCVFVCLLLSLDFGNHWHILERLWRDFPGYSEENKTGMGSWKVRQPVKVLVKFKHWWWYWRCTGTDLDGSLWDDTKWKDFQQLELTGLGNRLDVSCWEIKNDK